MASKESHETKSSMRKDKKDPAQDKPKDKSFSTYFSPQQHKSIKQKMNDMDLSSESMKSEGKKNPDKDLITISQLHASLKANLEEIKIQLDSADAEIKSDIKQEINVLVAKIESFEDQLKEMDFQVKNLADDSQKAHHRTTWRLNDALIKDVNNRDDLTKLLEYFWAENNPVDTSLSINWCTHKSVMRGYLIMCHIFKKKKCVICPEDCHKTKGTVYGTAIYTDDSPICKSAIHAGVVPVNGGVVRVHKLPGLEEYEESTRNGVKSSKHGKWTGSFKPIPVPSPVTSEESPLETSDPSSTPKKTKEPASKLPPETYLLEENESNLYLYLYFSVKCPPECLKHVTKVWGSGIYADESSICQSAIHAGFLTPDGGQVTVQKKPGLESYETTTQNGITSFKAGPWPRSFSFRPTPSAKPPVTKPESPSKTPDSTGKPTEPPQSLPPVKASCSMSAAQIAEESATIICPEGCQDEDGKVWGTYSYTDDSAICLAAIHAGVLTDKGGKTKIVKMRGLENYEESTKNGIKSLKYGTWSGSFIFPKSKPPSPGKSPESPEPVPGKPTEPISSLPPGEFIYKYKLDSAICLAAIHAGVLTDKGGKTKIVKMRGLENYEESTKNGIKSLKYGTWSGSFIFPKSKPPSSGKSPESPEPVPGKPTEPISSLPPVKASCSMSAAQIAEESATIICPEGCQDEDGKVWGTYSYTDDSAICLAAIHAGVLTDKGGKTKIVKMRGLENYEESTKNGIKSLKYGTWSGSFIFPKSKPPSPGKSPESPEPVPGKPTEPISSLPPGEFIYKYKLDSAICLAAIHAGVLTDKGGKTKIVKMRGLENYEESTKNGIKSLKYGTWSGSFIFPKSKPPSSGKSPESPEPVPGKPTEPISSLPPVKASCSMSAAQIAEESATIICPEGCQDEDGKVWGTYSYTDDSAICLAAIHAGVLTDKGGKTKIVKMRGLENYEESTKNGIKSLKYGTWSGSFIFPKSKPPSPGKSPESPEPVPGKPTEPILSLPPGEFIYKYKLDSAICLAAIHAGVLTDKGGKTKIVKMRGLENYEESTKNGIKSLKYGTWSGSFIFPKSKPPSPGKSPESPEPVPGKPTEPISSLPPVKASCSMSAAEIAEEWATIICPEGCQDEDGKVWGTYSYTDDSAICLAAIHAGVLTDKGGKTKIVKMRGLENYEESTKNGIKSLKYGTWSGSFIFPKSKPPSPGKSPESPEPVPGKPTEPILSLPPVEAPCSLGADEIDEERAIVLCAAECLKENDMVWGDDIYTEDSSVCRAAIHAGLLNDEGGRVEILKVPGLENYEESTKNGVKTFKHGSWSRSFMFPKSKPPSSTKSSESPGTVTGKPTEPTSSLPQVEAPCSLGADEIDEEKAIAAIHAGLLNDEGGRVEILKVPGLENYEESTKNGVKTFKHGSWSRSFMFPKSNPPSSTKSSESPGTVTGKPTEPTSSLPQVEAPCSLGADEIDEERAIVLCAAECLKENDMVWGDDIYTEDSSVCRAAIHAGLLNDEGGRVEILKVPGLENYEESTKNGVKTFKHGSWSRSFMFPKSKPLSSGKSPESPGTVPVEISCSTGADEIEDKSAELVCPEGCRDMNDIVWGTHIFTEDSSICRAAIHAGVLTNQGGTIEIRKIPGLENYEESTKNGVKSFKHGTWSESFMFPKSVSPSPDKSPESTGTVPISEEPTEPISSLPPVEISCSTGADEIEDKSAELVCPEGCQDMNDIVWGTHIFTEDSSICRAAIHAGVLTNQGGTIEIRKIPGLENYEESTKNGVKSFKHGTWSESFMFPKSVSPSPDKSPESTGTVPISEEPTEPISSLPPVKVLCSTGADEIEAESAEVECPANCLDEDNGFVWGNQIYTDDSSVCLSAIHDGKLANEKGGRVRFLKLLGRENYEGSTKNGGLDRDGSSATENELKVKEEKCHPTLPSMITVPATTRNSALKT
ncbi:Hypothetical predicted protein [Pelobates cultripes]|uniref:LCCL domain-containing protein n=1 Tax=Pelobates cultripes TaxID=61616 RepID=A0AAD1WHF7_PELCU|nr:Hypothetical predicted protein [Pelobates cultripes]